MSQEGILLATYNATMTTEKHCKLRGDVTLSHFFPTCNAPAANCLQTLSPAASLKSPLRKRRALIGSLSQNYVAGCDGHVKLSNTAACLATLRKVEDSSSFSQLATQHFVTLQVAEMWCHA